jgi:hypothetical protein
VNRSMNSPQASGSAPSLEGKVGEVVGGEFKMLLRWVWPQHADDGLVREASDESLSDESLASCSPRQDIGTRRRVKVRPVTDFVVPV